jgi:hypothetical protein
MSTENNNQGRSSYSLFRIILDMGMGLLYIVLAGLVFYTRKFGTIELDTTIVMGMCAVLLLYGSFRIFQGVQKLKQR